MFSRISVCVILAITAITNAAAPLPPALLRNIARDADVHIYNDFDDAFYIGRGLMSISAVTPGRKIITLPRVYEITDCFDAAAPVIVSNRLELDLAENETRVFLIKQSLEKEQQH